MKEFSEDDFYKTDDCRDAWLRHKSAHDTYMKEVGEILTKHIKEIYLDEKKMP